MTFTIVINYSNTNVKNTQMCDGELKKSRRYLIKNATECATSVHRCPDQQGQQHRTWQENSISSSYARKYQKMTGGKGSHLCFARPQRDAAIRTTLQTGQTTDGFGSTNAIHFPFVQVTTYN